MRLLCTLPPLDGVPDGVTFGSLADLADHAGLVCALTDRVDDALLAAHPSLRVVANVAVGYDNVDVAAAARRGVVVTNTPDVLTETTADLALALALAVARRLPEADAYVRSGRWGPWEFVPPLTGVDLFGGTLGVVGLGRIGAAVARRASAGFGMRVLYTARSPRSAEYEHVPLDELLRSSDVVSLHAPLTAGTRHLIGARELALMKPTAILVNTARGGLVDEAALVAALDAGALHGAGLDVFEAEPQVHPGLLARRENVVLAPHVGSATLATRRRMADLAFTNAVAVLEGRPPPSPVTP